MTALSYAQIQSRLRGLASGGERYGYTVQSFIDAGDTWLSSWANDGIYVLVQAALTKPENGRQRTLIDVHAGAAYGAQSAAGLYEGLCTATWRYDYGGPWARHMPDDTVTYGWRLRLPAELFPQETERDAFSFLVNMIDEFGQISRTLAAELVPLYGGHYSQASDPKAFGQLLAGLLPPPGH